MRILKLKCLEIIVNIQKIKGFNEKLLEFYWYCLTFDIEGSDICLTGIFKKLNEINQRWLLEKLIEILKKDDHSFIKNLKEIKLKVRAIFIIYSTNNHTHDHTHTHTHTRTHTLSHTHNHTRIVVS